MKTFRDADGREWLVKVDVTAAKRCKAQLGLNLYGLADEGFRGFAALVSDPIALCDVLYVLCREEAEKREVSDEAFGRAMHGDALDSAAAAFTEALIDFFPDARRRDALRKVMASGKRVGERMVAEAASRTTDEELRKLEEKAFASMTSRLAIKPSSNSPEPSESIPAP